MNPINSSELSDAFARIGVPASKVDNKEFNSLPELSVGLGEILIDIEWEYSAPDPSGRFELGLRLVPGISFSGKRTLFSDENVLYIGDDGSSCIVFVSEYLHGRIGYLFDPIDDISKFPYSDLTDKRVRYWEFDLLGWLKRYQKIGMRIFEEF